MRIKIASIVVRKRIRKVFHDIEALADSMKKYGQLSPIIVNRDNELIAGERRLTAAQFLGWTTIEAVVIDKEEDAEMLELELEENVQRSNLTQDEILYGFQRLDKLKNPGFFRRILTFFKRLFRRLFKRNRRRD
ncbi:MAG: ParB N-terminal domain-containing protein [Spirochaetales bacterium]|nr:ParB N-terminal domain-containing protein [Spirochaetales bacterium]